MVKVSKNFIKSKKYCKINYIPKKHRYIIHSHRFLFQADKIMMKERPRRPYYKSKPKSQIDFSLKLSNISSTVRVRDLKNALSERGVKPSDITWRGQRGFCYLHFGKLKNVKPDEEYQPVEVDSVVANLQELKIGEVPDSKENVFIVVEPTKPATPVTPVTPVTKIEVTDATSV